MIFLNSSANESSAKFIYIYFKVKQGRGHTEELRGIKKREDYDRKIIINNMNECPCKAFVMLENAGKAHN